MTVGTKIDELPPIEKSSFFPLFYTAAISMSAAGFDGSTFLGCGERLFRYLSNPETLAPMSPFIPRLHLAQKLILERITH